MFPKRLSALSDANSDDSLVIDPAIFQTLAQNFDQAQIFAQLKNTIGLQPITPQSDTYKDLIRYLKNLLQYPSTEKALFHRGANRLGKFDIQKESSSLAKSIRHFNKFVNEINNCQCCGLVKQQEELKVCLNSFKDVASVGVSTYMFYITMINLSYLLIIAFIIFGIFSLGSNIRTSQIWSQKGKEQDFSSSLMISLGSKICLAIYQTNQDSTLLIYQVWLGLAMVVSFVFAYVFMERIQVKEVRNVEILDKSASDFSVIIEGVPLDVTKKQLQSEIKRIFNEAEKNQENTESHRRINSENLIAKISVGIPRDKNTIKQDKAKESNQQKSKEKQKKLKQKIVSYIMELTETTQFKIPAEVRNQTEHQLIALTNSRKTASSNEFFEVMKKLGIKNSTKNYMRFVIKAKLQADVISKKQLQNQQYLQKNETHTESIKTDVFVTFESRKVKQKLLKIMEKTILDKFLKYLTLDLYQKKVPIFLNGLTYKVRIQQASQPEDIIWANIGTKPKELLVRKCVTFLITFFILGASFVSSYGLSTIQYHNQDNRYISILISLSLSIFNFIILYALRMLTSYELSVTHTDYQSSLAVKSIIAQLVNTIIIPILVNRFLKNKDYIYEKSGLAEDVFLLGITNSFLGPILKILDINYFFTTYLNVWYNERPSRKFYLSQIQLNEVYELVEFENGIEYVYIITSYLFTMFFMSLQPIIIVFAIFGYLMNYWAQKYCLYHRCRRPVPGTRILYDTMVQFIYAGGLFYSLGSLSFVNLIPEDIFQNKIDSAFIPNMIAVGVSVLSLFVPFSFLYEIMFGNSQNDTQQEDQFFSEDRVFLLSEYDRTNPATREAAVLEYIEFVNEKKKQIKHKNRAEKARFMKIVQRQSKRKSCSQRESITVPYNFSKFAPQTQSPILHVSPGAMQNFILNDITKAVNEELSNETEAQPNNILDVPEIEALDTATIALKFEDFPNNQENVQPQQQESQTEFYSIE